MLIFDGNGVTAQPLFTLMVHDSLVTGPNVYGFHTGLRIVCLKVCQFTVTVNLVYDLVAALGKAIDSVAVLGKAIVL